MISYRFLVVASILALGQPVFAATLVVDPGGGGDATTINQALESLDYNDGQPDLVLIGPGIYEEQIVPKGNAGLDSTSLPGAGLVTMEAIEALIATHPDPLILRGTDPSNPPVLAPRSESLALYGVSPHDPSDFFSAGVVLCAKDVSFENVNIRHSVESAYAINGMAGNSVWKDCVFSNGLSELNGHDDFWDYGNNPRLLSTHPEGVNIGLDQDYTYNNCLVDGVSVVDGSFHDTAFVWWHGYGDDAAALSAPVGRVSVSNCVFRGIDDVLMNFNSSDDTSVYSRKGGIPYLYFDDCYMDLEDSGFQVRGPYDEVRFNRCVFNRHSRNDPALRFRERSGIGFSAKPAIISNCIFSGPSEMDKPMVQIQNDPRNLGPDGYGRIHVVNNTFRDYKFAAIQIEGDAPNTIAIANNIFDAGTGIMATAVGVDTSLGPIVHLTHNGWNNNGGGDVVGTPTSRTGDIFRPPLFDGVTPNIPGAPPSNPGERAQQFHPSSHHYIDAGDNASYDAVVGFAGMADVDSLGQRIAGGTIDIGAQEFDPDGPTPVPTSTGTATPTATSNEKPTFTPTRDNHPTSTPTPDPFNETSFDRDKDDAIDVEDLLRLLEEGHETEGTAEDWEWLFNFMKYWRAGK